MAAAFSPIMIVGARVQAFNAAFAKISLPHRCRAVNRYLSRPASSYDSPLEGDGFEPAVPLKRHRFRATAPGLPPACRPSARNMATASLSLPFSKAGIVLVCY